MLNNFKLVDHLWKVAEKYIPTHFCLSSGYEEFDRAMDGGFREGELITISAPTGMGKTTFGVNLTANFNKKGVPSFWITYEMNPWYLKEKFMIMKHNQDVLVYTPLNDRTHFEYVKSELEYLDKHIDEAINDYACKAIFIDHLHYLIPLIGNKENFSLLVGSIVRELKKMAVRKNIIIFLIAHTKKIYQGEELDLSSIRDSSLIAQESDYVFLIKRLQNKEGNYQNISRIQLAKNRRTGIMFSLDFNYSNNTFLPITHKYNGQIID